MMNPILLAPLEFEAPSHVREALARLGRTEDLTFSPDLRRLAIAEFARNRILVLDVAKEARLATGVLALTDFVELSSSRIQSPHGLCFLDEETLVVANRDGATHVFRVPSSRASVRPRRSSPLQTIDGGWRRPKVTPGSVTVSRVGPLLTEVLVCNNFQNTVTRHQLDRHRNYRVRASEVLLFNQLALPDGVAVSRDGLWIAISNHATHCVLIYENTDATNPWTEPVGVLQDVNCPHGLAFSDEDRTLLVASAATPFVHVFARQASAEDDWRGSRRAVASIRVMNDETYLKGQTNPEEGGPKGLEVSAELNLWATTSEHQPLAFFELETLRRCVAQNRNCSQVDVLPSNPTSDPHPRRLARASPKM